MIAPPWAAATNAVPPKIADRLGSRCHRPAPV